MIRAARTLGVDSTYCSAEVCELEMHGCEGPESVDVDRVALPTVEPHFNLGPLLVDEDVRAGYEDPATLEQPPYPHEELSTVLRYSTFQLLGGS